MRGIALSTPTVDIVEQDREVARHRIHVKSCGTGPPLLVLHRSTGPMWCPFYDHIASTFRVIVPDMPGFGESERVEAARSPRDLAILLHQALELLEDGPVHAVGLGLGGWVLAEMATMGQQRFRTLTFVGAAGIKPRAGQISDPMMISWEDYQRLGFRDDEHFRKVFGDAQPSPEIVSLWDFSREMTARVTWKPWMWSNQLRALLPGVRTPSMIVWGGHDRVIPLDCAEQLRELLPASRLEVIDRSGHSVELEEPAELAVLVHRFSMDADR
jgi:pimeloyl-ACP methyl ester carboxylesterase